MPSDTTNERVQRFLEWVDAECAKRHWTRQDLAVRGGFASSAFTKLQNAQTGIGVNVARGIAAAFGVSQIEVFVQAGLLDVEEYKHEATTRRIDRIIDGLPAEDQEEIVALAETMATRRRARRPSQQSGTRAKAHK